MAILRFSLEVLDVGYLVSDTTNDRDEFDEVRPDEPVGAFAPGNIDGALAYIREEIMRHEAEVARHAAELKARMGENVVAGPGYRPAPPAADAPASPLIWEDPTSGFGPAAPNAVSLRTKSDREIVDEVNAVALTILRQDGFRSTALSPRAYDERTHENPRIKEAWYRAVEIYAQITGSEVSDALQAVLEDENPLVEVPATTTAEPVA